MEGARGSLGACRMSESDTIAILASSKGGSRIFIGSQAAYHRWCVLFRQAASYPFGFKRNKHFLSSARHYACRARGAYYRVVWLKLAFRAQPQAAPVLTDYQA